MLHKYNLQKVVKRSGSASQCNENAILQGENIRLLLSICMKCGFSGLFTITPKIIRILQIYIKNEGELFKKLIDLQSYRNFQLNGAKWRHF